MGWDVEAKRRLSRNRSLLPHTEKRRKKIRDAAKFLSLDNKSNDNYRNGKMKEKAELAFLKGRLEVSLT